jgi:hypothetical protein
MLNQISERRLRKLFAEWSVPDEFANPYFNYLVYGYGPGSFFTCVLANNWHEAIIRSHPSNTIEALKNLAKFTINVMPPESWGSPEEVEAWTHLTNEERRAILERCGLIYTPKQETFKAIKESA